VKRLEALAKIIVRGKVEDGAIKRRAAMQGKECRAG
jgi:hypothetical protein